MDTLDNHNKRNLNSKKEWKSRKRNPWGTDYNTKENLGWLLRNAFGVSKKNEGIVNYIDKEYIFDESITIEKTLVFAGDIMNLLSYNAKPSSKLKGYIDEADYFIANFEGTLTDEKGSMAAQTHNYRVINFLKSLKDPNKTYLSVVNNHTGDFSLESFSKSVEYLLSEGFNVFGTKSTPFFDIDSKIRILTCSLWSNLKCDWLVTLDEILNNSKEGLMNILYPHWGYELELYPRPEIVDLGSKIFNQKHEIEAIIGHHSHCPQPISIEKIDRKKRLIAYGLGDFTTGLSFNKYRYGMIVKIEIGPNKENIMKIRKVSWEYTYCHPIDKNEKMLEIDIIDNLPYLD